MKWHKHKWKKGGAVEMDKPRVRLRDLVATTGEPEPEPTEEGNLSSAIRFPEYPDGIWFSFNKKDPALKPDAHTYEKLKPWGAMEHKGDSPYEPMNIKARAQDWKDHYVIQITLHYPWNYATDPIGYADHPQDVEHVWLVCTQDKVPQIKWVCYSCHGRSKWNYRDLAGVRKFDYDGKEYMVCFVAWGSHANYFGKGNHQDLDTCARGMNEGGSANRHYLWKDLPIMTEGKKFTNHYDYFGTYVYNNSISLKIEDDKGKNDPFPRKSKSD